MRSVSADAKDLLIHQAAYKNTPSDKILEKNGRAELYLSKVVLSCNEMQTVVQLSLSSDILLARLSISELY